jgi:hypothetical protein
MFLSGRPHSCVRCIRLLTFRMTGASHSPRPRKSPSTSGRPHSVNPSTHPNAGFSVARGHSRSSSLMPSHCCKLFVVTKNVNSFAIKQIQTLATKHPGGDTSGTSQRAQRLSTLSLEWCVILHVWFPLVWFPAGALNAPLTPLPATHAKSIPASPFPATHTKKGGVGQSRLTRICFNHAAL